MAWADEQYHECLLNDPEAAPARDYLAERGITPDSIRRFQLGFAPDRLGVDSSSAPAARRSRRRCSNGSAWSAAAGKGPATTIASRGACCFRFSMRRAAPSGWAVACCRKLPTADAAKYVNSPETPLFSKSNLLYGLNIARDAIRKTSTALVMEGYTDCIVAHQFGFENTVAVLGTALGRQPHSTAAAVCRPAARRAWCSTATRPAASAPRKCSSCSWPANVDLRVLTLPDEMRPGRLSAGARGGGVRADLVEGAVDALAHAFRAATAGVDLQADLHAATQALEQLVATIAKAPRLRADTHGRGPAARRKILAKTGVRFSRARRPGSPPDDRIAA